MSWGVPFADGIDLGNDRVPRQDADRQNRTARAILQRLEDQPGLVLADEVGMGKTFVALAVGASVALARKQPVVVMIPSALKDKWPRDLTVFAEKCLPPALQARLSYGVAERATQFFKYFDDPPERRKTFIFLTHGALTRGLQDPWVKLALIRETFRRSRRLTDVRDAFPRFAGQLLLMQTTKRVPQEVFDLLLRTDPSKWRGLLERRGIYEDDDPVPEALLRGIRSIPLKGMVAALEILPIRSSAGLSERIRQAREAVREAIEEIWKDWLSTAQVRSPLLILDEAHHFKNPKTRHASLFQDKDAYEDATMLATKGPLVGVFERMLFLTATPFQLGHRELCEVLRRFTAVDWSSSRAQAEGKPAFSSLLDELAKALDQAQLAALRFEKVWGRLRMGDLLDVEGQAVDVERWWTELLQRSDRSTLEEELLKHHAATQGAVREAEVRLRPWVIRHAKRPTLGDEGTPRRLRLEGAEILDDEDRRLDRGLDVGERALLPFLLAARAAVAIESAVRRGDSQHRRAVFAEGLASSYEAYRYTRRNADGLDEDAGLDSPTEADGPIAWYLEALDRALPEDEPAVLATHPKISATVQRAVELWKRGEKVVVFSHFVRTSQALREHLSRAMDAWLLNEAKSRLGIDDPRRAQAHLERLGDAFFKEDGLRRVAEKSIGAIVESQSGLSAEEKEVVTDIVRRFVRTPSFLVRYFPLEEADRGAALAKAFEREDSSGTTLRQQIESFADFLAKRSRDGERAAYLEALRKIQTGSIYGAETPETDAFESGRPREGVRLLPNVRLVYGATASETRRNLMLAFNTPFFPEILVASAVLAEGVDLHLFCRHVIHHDLDWNPSTLEQRTGRVDRLGCKAEVSGRSIRNYLPYVAGTHDEKQFRVVRDRERWFSVVMGERFELDEATTTRIEARVPLPIGARGDLVMRLSLD
jgi:superfamily II DNA or RNA helicase